MTQASTKTQSSLSGPLVFTERQWAERVAAKAGFDDAKVISEVASILAHADVRPGKPPAKPHRLHVKAVYFAGIKSIRAPDGQHTRASAETALDTGAALEHEVVRAPFSFHHEFGPGMTAFATDGENSAGKSTILGVLLWALRGTVPRPTLQPDVVQNWLREAAVSLQLDDRTILVHWRIDQGRPEGAVFDVLAPDGVDLAPLADAGLASANQELQLLTAPRQPEGLAGAGTVVQPDAEPFPDVAWPGSGLVDQLVAVDALRSLTSFDGEDTFESAMAGVLMPRLDLEPIKVWQRMPGAADKGDAKIVEHGWKTLSQALAIIDPTSSSVLGEIPMLVNQLLTVFLGSAWSRPVITARWQKSKADQSLASAKRRMEADLVVRQGTQMDLQDRIDILRAQLDDLGDVPNYLDVQAATSEATRTAVAAAAAQVAKFESALTYGTAEHTLETIKSDLHALNEASATRRFWHSLRPSCCPRCDKTIEDDHWAREKEGYCSLCDGEFIEPPEVKAIPEQAHEPTDVLTDDVGDEEDQEDEIVALQEQVAVMKAQVVAASEAHDEARSASDLARAAAAVAAETLSTLDRAASEQRRAVENELNVLMGRLEERTIIDDDAAGADALAELEFVAVVLKAALDIATGERDVEQKQLLKIVSAVITEFGIEFGVRNLVRADLNAAGRLRTLKGETPHNFSDLAPGERLRVRIALIVGLLRVGEQTGAGRHPGLLIIDDLTSHEIDHADASKIATRLTTQTDLQVIAASTYAPTLTEAIGGHGSVVTPLAGMDVMF